MKKASEVRVFIGCESSGVVREAFTKRGFYCASCDFLPSEKPGLHYQIDVLEILYKWDIKWDLAILHPPCTFLSVSGLHWNKRILGRSEETEKAVLFVKKIMNAPNFKRSVIENPIGCLSSRIRKPDQIIQPYNFNENASKATCLWLNGVPKLINTGYFEPRVINGKKRWGNQTDSGQNNLPPSVNRWKERSKTYIGIANAMAEQWGNFLLNNAIE